MKRIRFLLPLLCVVPCVARGASNDFVTAAQLLSAAKNADIRQVQILINNGADVNFVDSTGLSLVCTALMNNDNRAAQILQMYGADASKCDRQIRQYNSRKKTPESAGLFSGLTSAHGITLAAGGAAVVVGGLLLLTDVFDPSGDGGSSSSSGNRPGGGGDSGTGTGGTEAATIPFGPAYFDKDGKIAYSQDAYEENLAAWNPSNGGLRQSDFNFFRPIISSEGASVVNPNSYLTAGITVPVQNYLLMMHGYSAFANGYMGQSTLRDASHNPEKILNGASGGTPVMVALITDNGINPTGSAGRGDGILSASGTGLNADTKRTDKYLNYTNPTNVDGTIILGTENMDFDFSGSGTAMNPFASADGSALGKIVAGWEGDRTDADGAGDLYGFIPNGRLAVVRTGGGAGWVNVPSPSLTPAQGTIQKVDGGTADTIQVGDTITLTMNGHTYNIVSALDGTTATKPTITIGGKTFDLASATTMLKGVCTSDVEGECDDVSDIAIYKGTDNFYYVNYSGANRPDAVFVINGDTLYNGKEYKEDLDIKNFQAMYSMRRGDVNVIANASLNPSSRALDYVTLSGMPAVLANSGTTEFNTFAGMINKYYDMDANKTGVTPSDINSQGQYAHNTFSTYSNSLPIIVNPAGEFMLGINAGMSPNIMDATFENYAPVIYSDLEHMFMTVVAVSHTEGTSSANTISGYGNGGGTEFGPLELSKWTDNMGTDDTTDDIVYSSRKCGIAGTGKGGVDPWCFAAAGATAEMATASAAGAVAALKGAFNYMPNDQIFALLALTADGYLLGTTDGGAAYTADTLAQYLRGLYNLPAEYYADTLDAQQYLDAFAEVYGYGLINLERATTPNKSIYYYDGNKIVSDSGDAYWRAAKNTAFRASGAFSPRVATLSAPFFDVLTSVDGEMSMPRVWENTVSLGNASRRALYMGDTLAELQTRDITPAATTVGNMTLTLSASPREYVDEFGGLDNLNVRFALGNFEIDAGYQHYVTDGASRFSGLSNPILGLATNAVTSGAKYKFGDWSFGVRAMSGLITDEGLLENDPTISHGYAPARLGQINGVESNIAWNKNRFRLNVGMGTAVETDTLLGAQSDGLLSIGAGDTTYVTTALDYALNDNVKFQMRGTVARTTSDAHGEFILGLGDVWSDAVAIGADIGNFNFSVSRPLAVNRGSMKYAYADYDIVETSDGKYELSIVDTHVADIDLRPENRELRFMGTYKHKFGEFTDGALGLIYRVNPNNTREFGNESIFMMKLSHRLGI